MNLRELAEKALQEECSHTYFHERGRDDEVTHTARKALFAAIEQCEKDAALGANVRAVVEIRGENIRTFHGNCNAPEGTIFACINYDERDEVCGEGLTLDEAVAALRERLETER